MQSDNYMRGHQNRIVAFLNAFSTGILIVHQPAKVFYIVLSLLAFLVLTLLYYLGQKSGKAGRKKVLSSHSLI